MKNTPMIPRRAAGFTLVEMAMVLMIIGLLLAGLIPTLSAQMESQRIKETRKTLEDIKDALLGFAVANGRLPCPASSTSSGQESFSGAVCTNSASGVVHGFVPAATMGLAPTDSEGFLLDDWGNRMRYAVYTGATYSGVTNNCNTTNPTGLPDAFTTTDRMKAITMTCLSETAAMLSVCSTAAAGSSCAAGTGLVSLTPAVIYSTGMKLGTGTDELENPNPNSSDNDRVFVSHTPTPDFDDMVIWLSPNILYNRMVTAGKLP